MGSNKENGKLPRWRNSFTQRGGGGGICLRLLVRRPINQQGGGCGGGNRFDCVLARWSDFMKLKLDGAACADFY